MANHGGDWRGDDWFVDEWHRGIGWAAAEDDQPGGQQPVPPAPPARKSGRGRLLAGFALGAATVLAVQFGSTVVTAAPVAVVTGTALPAAGAAGAAAPVPSPSPTATAPAA
ncbi:class F sortase, partial [Amycolatopsis sp. NPDC026612]